MSSTSPFLRYRAVSLRFGEREILNNFNLEVSEGEKRVLVGGSGSGKSSLLKAALGFVKIASGEIFYRGEPTTPVSAARARREIAYVGQEQPLGAGAVRDFLEETLDYRANRDRRAEIRERFRDMLDYFELPADALDWETARLSGGEKQRVALSLAAAFGKKAFLLDEVTSALDARLRDKTLDLFLGEPSWTTIVVTHESYRPEGATYETTTLGAS
jgi:putative ABC transport system ATP-binding protein